jgi:integrative and conjugative element protein (TIGR02256 family)
VSTHIETILVPSVVVLSANGSSDWQVRVQAHVEKKVSGWMKRAGRNETGGLLLGLAHRKRKIVYVTDVLPPSKDSEGTPYAFKRGVKDYPQRLDEIGARTGGLIGYVGEWHTHPDGAARLSSTDRDAVAAIRRHLDAAGIPTHIMIFGKNEIASFLFTPET